MGFTGELWACALAADNDAVLHIPRDRHGYLDNTRIHHGFGCASDGGPIIASARDEVHGPRYDRSETSQCLRPLRPAWARWAEALGECSARTKRAGPGPLASGIVTEIPNRDRQSRGQQRPVTMRRCCARIPATFALTLALVRPAFAHDQGHDQAQRIWIWRRDESAQGQAR